MAKRPDRVTNQQVIDTLRNLGYDIPPDFNMSGRQNGEFAIRVYDHLKRTNQGATPDLFTKAVNTTKDLVRINSSNLSPRNKMMESLIAYGVSSDDLKRIDETAKRIAPNMQITPAGVSYGDAQWFEAAGKVLGMSPAYAATQKSLNITPQGAPAAPSLPGDVRATEAPPPAATQQTATQQSKTTKKTLPGGGTPGAGTTTVLPTTNKAGTVVDKALPANASDAQIEDYFRKNYGAEAWMLNIPDFKKILRDVATNPAGWSPESIVSATQQTPWWQANGKNVAEYLKAEANDPIGQKQRIHDKSLHIENLAKGFGMILSPEKILELATNQEKWGWSDQTLNENLAQQWDWQQGQHNVLSDKMMQDAKGFLVPIDEATVDAWGKRLIAGGDAEAGNWREFLKEQAKSMFPAFASRLDGGEDMTAISKPYRDLASKWLEIDENDVDFTNPKWMGALDQVDDKGNHTSMSYADWTKKIMNDPVYRYDYTKNAKESAAGMATGILQKFGVMA